MATINLGAVGFTARGAYDAATTYAKQDIVTYDNNSYVSLVASNTGVTPGTDATKWEIFTQGISTSATPTNGVWYYDGTNVVSLAPGSANQVLRINSSNQLEWADDDARTGVKVANLLHGRSREVYRRTEVVMDDGSLRNWGYNGNYQHGTGSYTASKSYAVNPGFPRTWPGVKLDPYVLTNRNCTTITAAVTVANSVFELDAVANPNVDLTRGNIYKFDQSDATNVGHQLQIEQSTDGGTTWTVMSATGDEIGNHEVSSVYTTGSLGAAGCATYLRIHQDDTATYRYICSAHGASMGNTITLNSTGFVKFFRNNGMYGWTHYNNAIGIIDNDGKIWMWGNNSNGVIGTGNTSSQYIPYPASEQTQNSINGKTAKKFAGEVGASSNNTTVWALMTDNTVHHCGYSGHGQTGTGSSATSRWVQCINTTKIVDVHATNDSQDFLIMLEADGTVKHLGYGGTYGNGSNTNNTSIPTQVNTTALNVKVAEILYAGRRMVYVRDIDGNCWNWGNDNYGYLARGNNSGNYSPAIVVTNNAAGTNCVTEAVGNPDHDAYEHILTRRTDGKVYTSGYNGYGQLMNGNTTSQNQWVDVHASNTGAYWASVMSLGTGSNYNGLPTNMIKLCNMGSGSYGISIMLSEDGDVFSAGYGGNANHGHAGTGHVNNGKIHRHTVPDKVTDIGTLGYGSETGVQYLTEEGHLYVCGYNGDNMLTGDDAERAETPKQVLF